MTGDDLRRVLVIVATLYACWLGMQGVHELGHCIGAWLTGGRIERVVLHPLAISRTDLACNPHPLLVAWAGPIVGVLIPLLVWMIAKAARWHVEFILRFFAGFCLIANGLYIGLGSFQGVGDCGDMLNNGSQPWQLWLLGLATAPAGLWMLNNLGSHFGLGRGARSVSRSDASLAVAAALVLTIFGFAMHHWFTQ